MTQTNPLPGVALQWKAIGPFNQAPQGTVSIKPHFPFGEGAPSTYSVVFPATNLNPSNASFFAVPLIGTFDANGRLVGSDGYPLVIPALDQYPFTWIFQPIFYEIQIDLLGMSAQRGIFVAFQDIDNTFGAGIQLIDENASISAMTGSGDTYTGTAYLSDTIVSPILVNQSVTIGGWGAVVNSIDLATNSAAVTTTSEQDATSGITFSWGNTENFGVDLSQFVNWLA